MNERHLITRMGVGDLLIMFDFIKGLQLADLARDQKWKYTIGYPRALATRGEEYDQWVRHLHERVVPDVALDWMCDHPYGLGGGRGMDSVAYIMHQNQVLNKVRWAGCLAGCLDYIHYLPYTDEICDKTRHIDSDNYAVITTRLRATTKMHPFKVAKHFFDYVGPIMDVLYKKYEKVVIVGEPEPKPWHDPNADRPYPSIYNEILDYLNKNPEMYKKTIDATTKEFSMPQFLKENSICRDAKRVVCLGHGGNFVRQLYIGSELSCLMTSPDSGYNLPVVRSLLHKKGIGYGHQHLNNVKIFHERDFSNFLESL